MAETHTDVMHLWDLEYSKVGMKLAQLHTTSFYHRLFSVTRVLLLGRNQGVKSGQNHRVKFCRRESSAAFSFLPL